MHLIVSAGRSRAAAVARLLALLACLVACGVGSAAGTAVGFTLGIADEVVIGAWNMLRVETRDLPRSTLALLLDVGTLRDGEVPVELTFELSGGGGVNAFETELFVPPFRSLSWRVTTAERVVASGSLAGRETDGRPLDLVLASRGPASRAAIANAVGGGARVVEVSLSDLPVSPAAFDGVRSLTVEGSAPVDAVVAAAVAGASVVLAGGRDALAGPLAALVPQTGVATLGAGRVAVMDLPVTEAAVAAIGGAGNLGRPGQLLAAVLAQPLVATPRQAPVGAILIGSVAYAVLALVAISLGGAPGLLASVIVAAFSGFGAWRALRPPPPPYVGAVALAQVGGPLAIMHEALESLTLPRAVLDFPAGAAPVRPQAYSGSALAVTVPSPAWRSVTVRLPPRAVGAPLAVLGRSIRNDSSVPLTSVYVTGLGAQPDLAPGQVADLIPGEVGAYPDLYLSLVPALPDGTLVASSGCVGDQRCVVWLATVGTGAAPEAGTAEALATAPRGSGREPGSP